VFESRTSDEWLHVTFVGQIPFRTVTRVACFQPYREEFSACFQLSVFLLSHSLVQHWCRRQYQQLNYSKFAADKAVLLELQNALSQPALTTKRGQQGLHSNDHGRRPPWQWAENETDHFIRHCCQCAVVLSHLFILMLL